MPDSHQFYAQILVEMEESADFQDDFACYYRLHLIPFKLLKSCAFWRQFVWDGITGDSERCTHCCSGENAQKNRLELCSRTAWSAEQSFGRTKAVLMHEMHLLNF